MKNLITKSESIFIAGGYGMVGKAIYKNLLNFGYGKSDKGGTILRPTRKELDLTNYDSVLNWFKNQVNQHNIKDTLLNAKEKLSNTFDVEYLELRDEVELNQVTDTLQNSRLFVAVKLSNIRLIDNIRIG